MAPLIVAIALLIIINEKQFLIEPFVIITIGSTMSTVLFYSSLPFLINPIFYPIGFAIAFCICEITTFMGPRVIGFSDSDSKYLFIQLSSIVFYALGFVVDSKLRNGVLAQKSHLAYRKYK